MATEASAPGTGRPRPWLLVLLGIALVGFVASKMFSGGGTTPAVPSTTPQRTAAGGQKGGAVSPEDLDVRIEALKPSEVPADESHRNPFRFQPKAPPPQPPGPPPSQKPTAPPTPVVTGPPPPPPGPPPIGNTIKFIGIVDTGRTKIGAFSDCKATFPGREGEIIEGRYRVVRIGVESAVLEYADGKGRTTLPLNGQACVGK